MNVVMQKTIRGPHVYFASFGPVMIETIHRCKGVAKVLQAVTVNEMAGSNVMEALRWQLKLCKTFEASTCKEIKVAEFSYITKAIRSSF